MKRKPEAGIGPPAETALDTYSCVSKGCHGSSGEHTLFMDFTVTGDRSFFVTVNGGTPIEFPVSGVCNSTPYITSVSVTLQAGANTVEIHNDEDSHPTSTGCR